MLNFNKTAAMKTELRVSGILLNKLLKAAVSNFKKNNLFVIFSESDTIF